MHRQWLDWQQPLLPAAAAWLIGQHSDGKRCDLRQVRCVLPGSRAGRLLLHSLLAQCAALGLRLVPPQVLTPGKMVDQLVPPTPGTASALECTLGWMHALREAEVSQIAALLPSRPDSQDWPAWHELAAQIGGIVEELSGELLSLRDVSQVANRMDMDREALRWSTLERLADRYRERLRRCDRVDPHERRREAVAALVDADTPVDPGYQLVLIGVVDLARVQRAVVRAYGERATALIHAPEQLAHGFDADACLDRSFWTGRSVHIPDSQLIIADRPADQAQAVVECLAELGGRYRPEQISIGIGDDKLSPTMAQAGEWADLTVHDPRGQPVLRSRPFRLLEAGLEWAREPRFAAFASLMRHPDVEAWVRRCLGPRKPATTEAPTQPTDPTLGPPTEPTTTEPPPQPVQEDIPFEWLTVLDRYYTAHLQDTRGGWLGDDRTVKHITMLDEIVGRLFAPLAGERRPLTEWFEPVLEVLRHAYGHIDVGTPQLSEARVAATCLEIARTLGGLTGAALDLQPRVDGPTALRLVLAQIAGLRVPEDPRAGQVEMLGWLDLHHDPAPILILAGFNDGAIPQAVSADAFLPDGLREHLGILSNGRRYARDLYLLEAIRHSRERCTFIAGRQAADGEPLTPSRLLLAGEQAMLPARVLRLCDPQHALRRNLPYGAPPAGGVSGFRIPDALANPLGPEAMTVTEFGWYLRCPFRYYLKYVRRLREIDDSAVELDALQFGNLTHEVLQGFGEDAEHARSSDPKRIAGFLEDLLVSHARDTFGAQPLPAIRIQLARLRERLRVFARHQARRSAEGWVIRHCEFELPEHTHLEIPDQPPMRIKGKIDRIDQSERDGSWMIIDYKTSEAGKTPDRTHKAARSSGRVWDDLQLPLYHHLAAQHGFTGTVQLAYMNLPKKPEGEALHVARWSTADLHDAIGTARDIVRNVRAGRFDMAEDYPARFEDAFANICQTRVFGGGEDLESET
ncbi:MAG: PD-(D/E)XK nuclease family protein [Nannocystis sp.]|uniref:PD-(D/E)XK nuclease family protein n=1 Tax=Nannocystis sp. TaxID=1962667 RepID=UPI002420C60F|nr:PD-(D/E)XK nuclease family protein [Nannocystis sp.]MBK9753216.1 PD-(D/E)XK nuclease family protein [Nannocystis sp.]